MILFIDQLSAEPIYLQIRAQVLAAIAREELQAGDRLPSVRSLASDLGVNLHTVNKAYAMLRDEGYLLMRGRSGAIVADASRELTPEASALAEARLAAALRDLALEHKARGGTYDGFLALAASQAQLAYGAPAGAPAADTPTTPATSPSAPSASTGKDPR